MTKATTKATQTEDAQTADTKIAETKRAQMIDRMRHPGNPAVGHDLGPGPQPYPPGQEPRVASETLGGVPPDRARPERVAAAQAEVDRTVLHRTGPVAGDADEPVTGPDGEVLIVELPSDSRGRRSPASD